MSFNERLHAAKQTYRNYLQAHPDSKPKTLKALTKAVSSFYTRKVTALDSCNNLQQSKGGESLFSRSDKALIERKASSHSIDSGSPDASQATDVNKSENEQIDEAPLPMLHESTGENAESRPVIANTPEAFPIPDTPLLDNNHSKHKGELAKAGPKRRLPRQGNPLKTQRPPEQSKPLESDPKSKAFACINDSAGEFHQFLELVEQCSVDDLCSLAQTAKEVMKKNTSSQKKKHRFTFKQPDKKTTSPYLEAINKKLIKKQLEAYIENHQTGLFRQSGVKSSYETSMEDIARTPLEEQQLADSALLSSLFKALVKSAPPFSRELTDQMLRAASLYESGQKQNAQIQIKEARQHATPNTPAQKAWFNDVLSLMKRAHQHAPDVGKDGLTDKNRLCNFFANFLFQFPEMETPKTSEAALEIRNEGERQLKQAEIALAILLTTKE